MEYVHFGFHHTILRDCATSAHFWLWCLV